MYIDLNYLDIIVNYESVMNYCLRSSDTFSVITKLIEVYSDEEIVCEHENVLGKWKNCLYKQVVGIKEWPGTETLESNMVMKIYDSNQFFEEISDLPNLFHPFQNQLPWDVCFYRNGKPWLVTTSNEEVIYMAFPSNNDLEFLRKHNIRYYKSYA